MTQELKDAKIRRLNFILNMKTKEHISYMYKTVSLPEGQQVGLLSYQFKGSPESESPILRMKRVMAQSGLSLETPDHTVEALDKIHHTALPFASKRLSEDVLRNHPNALLLARDTIGAFIPEPDLWKAQQGPLNVSRIKENGQGKLIKLPEATLIAILPHKRKLPLIGVIDQKYHPEGLTTLVIKNGRILDLTPFLTEEPMSTDINEPAKQDDKQIIPFRKPEPIESGGAA